MVNFIFYNFYIFLTIKLKRVFLSVGATNEKMLQMIHLFSNIIGHIPNHIIGQNYRFIVGKIT